MHFIFTHWISALVVVVFVGGLVLWITSARTRSKETYPLPKRKIQNRFSTKEEGPPLLIRLPKLG
ncbi:MAG: hypothetical protein KF860_04375 [Cyclobacteriaceae bacterium]|nr:hypothetical protein [Cyclobacteriaceae bacterium]